MLQSTKCYKVLYFTMYKILLHVTKCSMFLHGKLLRIKRFIFISKKVETLRLCSTSHNFSDTYCQVQPDQSKWASLNKQYKPLYWTIWKNS